VAVVLVENGITEVVVEVLVHTKLELLQSEHIQYQQLFKLGQVVLHWDILLHQLLVMVHHHISEHPLLPLVVVWEELIRIQPPV